MDTNNFQGAGEIAERVRSASGQGYGPAEGITADKLREFLFFHPMKHAYFLDQFADFVKRATGFNFSGYLRENNFTENFGVKTDGGNFYFEVKQFGVKCIETGAETVENFGLYDPRHGGHIFRLRSGRDERQAQIMKAGAAIDLGFSDYETEFRILFPKK